MIDKRFAHTLSSCPLCGNATSIELPKDYKVDCKRCGKFFLEGFLAQNIGTIADKHLLSGFTREHWEVCSQPACIEDSDVGEILAQCPRTFREKVHKLLLALNRRTKYYGQEITLPLDDVYPLAYAKNSDEMYAFLVYLTEQSYITSFGTSSGYQVVVKAKGIEAVESRRLSPPVTVFISSTCYDLIDLRREVAEFLESNGFIVKISDDPYRIDLEPVEDSIQTCLRNVETADVIICIIDGRYGPPLPPDNEFSATHHEVKHAHKLGKSVYIFGRDKALAEYDLLRRDINAPTFWVERYDSKQRNKWFDFVNYLRDLPIAQTKGHLNWIDPFHTSVQLKKLVMKRLVEYQHRLHHQFQISWHSMIPITSVYCIASEHTGYANPCR